MTPPPVIEIESLSFEYVRGRPVLEGVAGGVAPGRLLVVLGPNASGKTTLLKLILGSLRPSRGEVRLLGRELREWRARDRAAVLSYVPQRSATGFSFTVREVVEMGRYALDRRPDAVEEALSRCGLEDLAARSYDELSAGQKQRVLVARALCQSAGKGRAMLLDEPASSMDLFHAHRTLAALCSLRSRGLAVVVVLQDLNLAAAYADDVWLMESGRIIACGPWDRVLRPEVLEPVYGMRLLAAGTDRGPDGDGERPLFAARWK